MPNNHFTGVLAVLHTPTADGRQLDQPHPDLTRPLPLPLVRPGEPGIGRIDKVWRDGNLIRYAGTLDDEHPDAENIAAGIRAGQLVGMLDIDDAQIRQQNGNLFSDRAADTITVMSGWRVVAVTLLDASGKAWPEVSLSLE